MNIAEQFKILAQFASTDETRPMLQHIYQCPKLKAAVATDGHRLIASPFCYDETQAKKAINAKHYLKTKEAYYIEPTMDYPNTAAIIPDEKRYIRSYDIEIPEWTKRLKPIDNCKVTINQRFDIAIRYTEQPDDLLFDLNLSLFTPLYGQTITMKVIDANSPVYFKVAGTEMFGVVMPLRKIVGK